MSKLFKEINSLLLTSLISSVELIRLILFSSKFFFIEKENIGHILYFDLLKLLNILLLLIKSEKSANFSLI